MATTTTNYGFDIPQSTDLVKDGATAIATLGQDIDTAMNTALGTKKAGMVLLNTTSFSGVSSQSVNDVFSATYKNYRILLNIDSASLDSFMQLRFRVSGSDNTTSNYHTHIGISASSSDAYGGSSSASGSSIRLNSGNGATNVKIVEGVIYNPFAAVNTIMSYNEAHTAAAGANPITGGAGVGLFNGTTSFTGFSIFPSSGTVTGQISIFGVNA